MKTEKEIKKKIEDLHIIYDEPHIKQTKIDILEWVLSDEPKFKIGDKVVYRKNQCEFLGTISLVAENNRYFVRFENCIINELCLDESVLVKFIYKRLYDFINTK
jgi:hypothetical protein